MARQLLARLALAAVLALLTACATPQDAALKDAVAGQAADGATTAIGLAQGLSEANPLGLGLLIVKPGLIAFANTRPEPGRTALLQSLSGIGWGAAAHNLCVIAFDPASVVACLVAGVAVGMWRMEHPAADTDSTPETTSSDPQHGPRPATP